MSMKNVEQHYLKKFENKVLASYVVTKIKLHHLIIGDIEHYKGEKANIGGWKFWDGFFTGWILW